MTRHLPLRLTASLIVLAVAALAPAQTGTGRLAAGQIAPPPKAAPAQPQKAKPSTPPPAPAAKPSTPVPPAMGPKRVEAAQPPTAKPSAVAAEETPGPVGYGYRAEGRRDPFVSLWSTGTGIRQPARTDGLAGVYTVDLLVKGILQSNGKFVAIVLGPDGKRQYILHTNDRLADGIVKAITADSVLILQEVSDPLSLAKQREVRKTLRAVEEVK